MAITHAASTAQSILADCATNATAAIAALDAAAQLPEAERIIWLQARYGSLTATPTAGRVFETLPAFLAWTRPWILDNIVFQLDSDPLTAFADGGASGGQSEEQTMRDASETMELPVVEVLDPASGVILPAFDARLLEVVWSLLP
ncbi:hypothetical protein A1351_23055 [Methylosinus sp. R-45379]|uniref:hypothetical protein n=1 Tax=Methylosinus sp. R-45379 TaxID=980563 RepID=UPI0007C95238|nr:hypothetical protein [Methylosinus sp. R-45379]OAI30347.1 hypothetical protein A1351_23055 [Methylosinus sp. R-45379]